MAALPRRLHSTLSRLLPQPLVGAGTALLALCALVAAWWRPLVAPSGGGLANPTGLAIALFLAMAAVAAYHYPVHIRHQTQVLMVSLVYYLLAVLVSPPLAALAAGAGALGGELSRRRRSGAYPSDIMSEVGRRVLLVLLGALVAHSPMLPHTEALLAAALALALADAVTFPLVLAPMSGDRPWRVLLSTAREASAAEGVQYVVGIVGALAAERHPWTLALLVVPAALVYTAYKMIKEMHDGTRQLLEGMADTVDLRDPYTGGHSRRVTEYSAAILREMGLQGHEVTLILTAARVHDIGKIGIPDAVLHKPGPLTPEERAIMESHAERGAEVLQRYADFARGVEIVRHHHESWDGSGYPHRLKGPQIPFGSRVIAVADSFDAMTSDRPYRAGMTAEKAVCILREGRNRQWDAAVVDAFLRAMAAQLISAGALSPDAVLPSEATLPPDALPPEAALSETPSPQNGVAA